MAVHVDCAVIHGCDWDTHIAKARPFVEAGKAILIDKPLAGKLAHLNQLRRWSASGARIAGGSSLLYCAEIVDWLAQPVAQRGAPHTVVCGCGVDEFNYGIHAYALLIALLGTGVHSVQHLGQKGQRRIWVRWADGRAGLVSIGPAARWLPHYATILTGEGTAHLQIETGRLYHSLLVATLPYLAGEVTEPPLPIERLILPELCALAALVSWQENDREVALDELSEGHSGYDGRAFALEYRRAKYPSYPEES
jgi:hypothetical protein